MRIKSPRETEKELKEFWKIDDLKFTAQFAINKQGKGYFRNIRKQDGNICFFPDNSRVNIPASNIDLLESDREYLITAFVAPEAKRKELGIEYLLYLDTKYNPPKINQQSPKQYVQKLYSQYQAAEGILKDSLSGAIRRLAVETNKKAETFIYEILQNADDYPDPVRKKVNIRFKILDNYLIVTHNGQPFKENNVYAICSVATGDKERDLNKTGYKGIGFKSIFKHSNYVWIHSGVFSFRFDEDYHRRKGNQTFWQLIPIWTEVEAVDKVVCTPDIINAPVSIVIRPKDGLSRLNEYANIFEKVFQDERVLLFLRSVESLTFQRGNLSFTKAKSKDSWEISDLPEFEVPTELQQRINQVIDRGGDDRVPDKFKDIEKSKITFATAKRGGKLVTTENTRIYAYLPTDLNFGLPFLINGDFIPDGSREKLFWDLDWNQFLFKQAGKALVEWLQKLYIKYKDASALILMPDISRLISEELDESKRDYLQLFAEGTEGGIKNIAFIPDTKGNFQLLNDLVIDLTGLFDIMGEDAFRKCTEIEDPIMQSSFASVSIIHGLMITYELGKEFSKDGLLDILTNDDFVDWLKKGENNVRFLSLLKTKGWLDEFRERSIFLKEDGELDDANSVYYDLGDDAHLIDWMEIPRLHQRVKKAFKQIEVPTLIYEPQFFIDNFILKYKSEIDARLDDPLVNVKFYQYLFKHNESLTNPKFENGQLGYFKVLGFNGCIIKSVNSKGVYLVNNDLKKLIENNSLPADHIALIDPNLFGDENMLDSWKTFFKRFEVKEFTDATMATFINDEIVLREDEIFKHFELSGNKDEDSTLQKGNIALWIFLNSALNHIAKAKEKEFKESVSQLPIYAKNEGQLYPLKGCYLPNEYTGNETLERLVEQHSDIQIEFVSDLYLTHKALSVDKWNLLFQNFHVKTDVKDLLLHYLIPEINDFSEENLIAVTRLIFENRSFLKEKLSTLNLRLKTTSGFWLSANETIIGAHYSESELENQILPSLKLNNTISDEYSNIDLKKWYDFFKALGAIEYQSEQDIITRKIKSYFEDEEQLNDNDAEFTFSIVKDLVELNAAEKLSDKHYESLRLMHLLLKAHGNVYNYEVASKCHFASEFKPKLDLDAIIPIDQRPDIFVSVDYLQKCGVLKDVKAFFKKTGVKEDFYIVKSDVKARKELEPSFISFIDNSNPKIKSNALSWGSQHKIKPWLDLPYLEYLNIFAASILFWEKIASNEKFLKSIFESLQYHYYFPTVTIPSYIEWFLKNTASIPARDGKCYKPSELYSTKLEKYVKNNSLLSKIDLRNIKYADKSLEEHLGFKMKLTLDLCLDRFTKLKNVNQLKKEGTWEIFIQLLEKSKLSEAEKSALNEFVQAGFLPNQLNAWKALDELYFIQDDFDLGVGNSPYLIHDELRPVAMHLEIKGLTTGDFNPEFKEVKNENFKEILTSRLKFIALTEKPADWVVKATELSDLIEPVSFESARKISFSYREVDPAIENTEKTFYEHNHVVYYIGNWKGARASELFYFIHQLLKLEHISVKVLQDLLLLPEAEIFNFFEEKNIEYPDTWKPHELSLREDAKPDNGLAENTQSRNNNELEKSTRNENKADLTDEEIAELEALLNRQLSSSEMANTLIIALYRALKHYEASGYNVTATKANIDECIRKRMLEGVVRIGTNDVITVLVRSAKKGILHLNYQAWSDLNNINTELFVVTGNSSTDYLLFPDQICLSSINKDSWVAKIGGDDKYGELSSLLNGEYLNPDKKFAPLQFLIRIKENGEYQSIFERIYSIEKFPEFDQLD